MIVAYDEHGGFFDHISPPPMTTEPPPNAKYTAGFTTLGVRVPAFVISPFVEPKSVSHILFDHTSILKFLGQKFGANGSYSPFVDNRAVGSVADILTAPDPANAAPTIGSLDDYLAKESGPAGFAVGAKPETVLQQGFQEALDNIRDHPNRQPGAFEDLLTAFPRATQAAQS